MEMGTGGGGGGGGIVVVVVVGSGKGGSRCWLIGWLVTLSGVKVRVYT